MEIKSFRKYEKNTLKGFVEVETPQGMIIKNLTYHVKKDGEKTSEWLGLPSREYTKEDGSKGYANIVDFVTKNLYWDFCKEVIEALKEHLGQKQLEDAWEGNEERGEMPF